VGSGLCVDGGSDGSTSPPPISGTVGPSGGSVSSLYFAVIGDTRPANIDATASYPTAIITQIYSDIAAMSPRPEFVVATGDYMYADPILSEGKAQLALYTQAASQFGGPVFAAMGNHECTGATSSNCNLIPTSNMSAFMDALVKPLGKTQPYYTIPVNDTAGKWTAKIVIVACNAWDATQSSWLSGELAKPTTYTFVVRHEPLGTMGAPCVAEMDALLQQATYDLFIVGHSHTFAHSAKQVIVGNGGAPLDGSVAYGFATVAQQASGLVVTQYDYMTGQPLSSFNLP
jgi:hypothetical protein